MSRPPFNLEMVEVATIAAIAAGHPVLQTHYYGGTDEAHVEQLLDWLDPALGSMVIDAGSGLGEVSRLMAEMRPDLAFLLVNLSPLQLSLGPADSERFQRLHADCQDLRGFVPDEFAQAVMFSSALCQMDAELALAEAYRVLSTDGVLLVNDMARLDDQSQELETLLAARVLPESTLISQIEAAGFLVDYAVRPDGNDGHFRRMLAEAGHESLIDNVFPVVIRAIKRGSL